MKPNQLQDSGGFPPLSGKLENFVWKFSTLSLSKKNNISVHIQKDSRWYEWSISGETSCKNASIAYFSDSIDNSILYAEGNACGILSIPIIEITFDNDHIHVFHYLPK